MAASGVSARRRTAYASRMEAKRQRQKVIVIAGFVLMAIVLAYEIPHTLKLTGGGSHSAASTASSTPAAVPPAGAAPHRIPKSMRSSNDPFVRQALVSGDPGIGSETAGHDPFAGPSAPAPPAAPAAPAAPAVSTSLPGTIVLGTPGAHRHATHGWIVILASIPTAQGRGAAERFASRASGVGSLQILNSSNQRPLRGGYWVVYTGPVSSLAQVTQRASSVHAAGYTGAYIRELIVYR